MDEAVAWLQKFGVHVGLLIAGAFGGLLSIRNKEGLTGWEKVLSVISGMAIANYCTPLVFEYININEGARYGAGFLFGFSGFEGVKWLIATIKEKHNKK